MSKDKIKQKLMKRLGKELEAQWTWQGTRFTHAARIGVTGEYTAFIVFTAGHYWVKANIHLEEEYGLPDGVRMFAGENGLEDMVEWVAEKLIDLYETVSARTAPYQKGHEDYLKALKGA